MSSYYQSSIVFGVKIPEEYDGQLPITKNSKLDIHNYGSTESEYYGTIIGYLLADAFLDEETAIREISLTDIEKKLTQEKPYLIYELKKVCEEMNIPFETGTYLLAYMY